MQTHYFQNDKKTNHKNKNNNMSWNRRLQQQLVDTPYIDWDAAKQHTNFKLQNFQSHIIIQNFKALNV